MAMSLAFHIVFAAIGIAMPLLMAVAEALWLRTKDDVYLTLAKRWAKGTAIFFAVGAVSGTVLSFELGLLWPHFMAYAGPIFGMPFSLEGFAFFVEAIFLGIYLYGWKKISPTAHWLCGVMVAFSGVISGIFVVIANAWMNTPTGFDIVNGNPVHIDPIAAMRNPAAVTQTIHMSIAAYQAVGIAVAGVHAWMLLKDPRNLFHRRAFAIAGVLTIVASFLQPLSGDFLARQVARNQHVKLAAMEGQFETRRGAPLRVGGIPDEKSATTRYTLEIPKGLSLLAYGKPDAEVHGLNDFPRKNWPPVAVVHVSFQIMIACGVALLLLSLGACFLVWRHRALPLSRRFLHCVVACAPLGMIAIEAGWTVTETGRQPWVIYNVMRTKDAVTPMPYLVVPFLTFTFLYLVLAAIVIALLKRQVFASPDISTLEAGHG